MEFWKLYLSVQDSQKYLSEKEKQIAVIDDYIEQTVLILKVIISSYSHPQIATQ